MPLVGSGSACHLAFSSTSCQQKHTEKPKICVEKNMVLLVVLGYILVGLQNYVGLLANLSEFRWIIPVLNQSAEWDALSSQDPVPFLFSSKRGVFWNGVWHFLEFPGNFGNIRFPPNHFGIYSTTVVITHLILDTKNAFSISLSSGYFYTNHTPSKKNRRSHVPGSKLNSHDISIY